MAGVESISAEPVEVMIGGKNRRIMYTLASFRYITRKWGSIQKLIASLQDADKIMAMAPDTLDAVIDFVYAGLLPFDKRVSPDEVADMLTPGNMQAIIEAATRSFTGSMPEVDPTMPPPSPRTAETKDGTGPT